MVGQKPTVDARAGHAMKGKAAGHLYRQGGVYYYRQAIPADIRPVFGRRELRYSLRTGYLREARQMARKICVCAIELFDRARQRHENDVVPFDIVKSLEEEVEAVRSSCKNGHIQEHSQLCLQIPHVRPGAACRAILRITRMIDAEIAATEVKNFAAGP